LAARGSRTGAGRWGERKQASGARTRWLGCGAQVERRADGAKRAGVVRRSEGGSWCKRSGEVPGGRAARRYCTGRAEVRGSRTGTALEQTWRKQERAGTSVDAARAGGVTLTRECHASQAALERFADGAGANRSDAERVARVCAR
jgi:hypothetical protein